MSDSDLLVMLPWAVFGVGVVTIMVLAFSGEHRRDRHSRRPRNRGRPPRS